MFARNILILSGLALSGLILTAPVKADQWDKKTVLTVNETIQLPHTVLVAGTYVFKLLDSAADRHIVQIFTADETHLITTILAIPNYRLEPTGKSEFRFWETPPGQPRAMRAWFYPGDNFGQEFAYPKSLSVQIAKVTKTPVPTVMADDTSELKTATVAIVDDNGNEAPLKTEDRVIARNEPAPVAIEEEAERQRTPPAPARLPHTASAFPLFGLLGLASLATFGVLRRSSGRA